MLISIGTNAFASLPNDRGWASYPFNTLTLSLATPADHEGVAGQRCIDYEGLLRARPGQALKPETVLRSLLIIRKNCS
jgi:hypothetical protein